MKNKYYITDETMEFARTLAKKLRNEFNWRSASRNGQVVYNVDVTRNEKSHEPEIHVAIRRPMTEKEETLFKEACKDAPVPVKTKISGPSIFA